MIRKKRNMCTYNITVDDAALAGLQPTIGNRDAVGRWLQKQVDALVARTLKGGHDADYYDYEKWDVTKTEGYRQAMDDIREGRVFHADSVDDMMTQILG